MYYTPVTTGYEYIYKNSYYISTTILYAYLGGCTLCIHTIPLCMCGNIWPGPAIIHRIWYPYHMHISIVPVKPDIIAIMQGILFEMVWCDTTNITLMKHSCLFLSVHNFHFLLVSGKTSSYVIRSEVGGTLDSPLSSVPLLVRFWLFDVSGR